MGNFSETVRQYCQNNRDRIQLIAKDAFQLELEKRGACLIILQAMALPEQHQVYATGIKRLTDMIIKRLPRYAQEQSASVDYKRQARQLVELRSRELAQLFAEELPYDSWFTKIRTKAVNQLGQLLEQSDSKVKVPLATLYQLMDATYGGGHIMDLSPTALSFLAQRLIQIAQQHDKYDIVQIAGSDLPIQLTLYVNDALLNSLWDLALHVNGLENLLDHRFVDEVNQIVHELLPDLQIDYLKQKSTVVTRDFIKQHALVRQALQHAKERYTDLLDNRMPTWVLDHLTADTAFANIIKQVGREPALVHLREQLTQPARVATNKQFLNQSLTSEAYLSVLFTDDWLASHKHNGHSNDSQMHIDENENDVELKAAKERVVSLQQHKINDQQVHRYLIKIIGQRFSTLRAVRGLPAPSSDDVIASIMGNTVDELVSGWADGFQADALQSYETQISDGASSDDALMNCVQLDQISVQLNQCLDIVQTTLVNEAYDLVRQDEKYGELADKLYEKMGNSMEANVQLRHTYNVREYVKQLCPDCDEIIAQGK